MKSLSLVWRVRWLVALSAVGVVGVVSFAAYQGLRAAHLGQLDRLLDVMARGVVAAVATSPHEAPELASEIEVLTVSPWRGPTSDYRVWFDGETPDLASSVSGGRSLDLAGRTPPALGATAFFDVADKKKRWRAAWSRRAVGDRTVNAVIVHPANYEQRRLHELLLLLLGTGSATAMVAALLATPLTRMTLKPLEDIVGSLETIEPEGGRPQRSTSTPRPAEIELLAQGIDDLVERFRLALERRRALVGEAAHQLRTPLALVRSTLELGLSRREDPMAVARHATEALEDLARLQRMIEQLVALARAEAGPPRESSVELRLDALLEELAAAYQPQADERGITLECDRLAAAEVLGDESMLRLLFGSLLENAIQYGPQGGAVRLGLELGAGGRCTVTIQDDGGAIPREALDRLFERFYRTDGAKEQHPSGAGLGLSIAREITRGHGGEIWVTSSPGSKTTLHVRLPTRVAATR